MNDSDFQFVVSWALRKDEPHAIEPSVSKLARLSKLAQKLLRMIEGEREPSGHLEEAWLAEVRREVRRLRHAGANEESPI